MKRFSCFVALLLLASLFSGCGVAYQIKRDELSRTARTEDYGPKPPSNHREITQQLIRRILKDPDSAKFESWNDGYTSIIQSGFASPMPMLVWITSVDVNGKNSYGGYTGFNTWHFAWQNGSIVATSTPRAGDSRILWDYR